MYPQTDQFVEGKVVQLWQLHYSERKIVAMLQKSGDKLTKTGVHGVIKKHKQRLGGLPPRVRKLPEQNLPKTRTPEVIRKVADLVYKKNPPTQRALGTKLGMSVSTVNKIIHVDLGLCKRTKTTTHHLTKIQAEQRAYRGNLFINYLGMFKTRLIFTIDETVITLNDFDKDRPIYYVGEDQEIPAKNSL